MGSGENGAKIGLDVRGIVCAGCDAGIIEQRKVQFTRRRDAPRGTMSAREREVMSWTGEGKTAYEIGLIISISERTVNFHVNNVLLKLRATNKVQAVVKAIAMGLIQERSTIIVGVVRLDSRQLGEHQARAWTPAVQSAG